MRAYVSIWEFRVEPASLSEFETAYGADGDWARLFQRANGYVGTELLRDRDDRHRYVTIDRWRSREAYDAFQSAFGAEYAMLDARFERYFADERLIEQFETIE